MNYARLVFKLFGDRVKNWITINEPKMLCWILYGYAGSLVKDTWGTGEYICGHNILIAHAKVYRLYQKVFQDSQNGKQAKKNKKKHN